MWQSTRLFAGTAILSLIACSQSTSANTGTDHIGQSYSVVVAPNLPTREGLPATTEMRLVGFDVATYVERQCRDAWQSAKCEVFAQTDKSGSLLGYLKIEGTGDELSFNTDTRTNPSSGTAKECLLGGALENIERRPDGEFRARSMFQTRDATGMIYLNRVGDNLKVNDERWNYCYTDQHIDDVYTLIGTLTRSIDRKKWPKTPT